MAECINLLNREYPSILQVSSEKSSLHTGVHVMFGVHSSTCPSSSEAPPTSLTAPLISHSWFN